MYDSTSPGDIPATAEMVAGYIDGAYAWSPSGWARFPAAVKVTVATQPGTDAGDVLDVELGDATPAQAPAWIRMRQTAGLTVPTIYCASFAVPQVRQLCAGLRYALWVAEWTGHPHAVAGAVAVQYADPSSSGGHYDLSLVTDPGWPHPQEDPVATLGQKRATIFTFRVAAFGEWPESQEAVDAYATQIADDYSNVEAILTALESDYVRDGGKPLWKAQIPPPVA